MNILLLAQEDWLAQVQLPSHVRYEWYRPDEVEAVLIERYRQYQLALVKQKNESTASQEKVKKLKRFNLALVEDLTGFQDGRILQKYLEPYTLLYSYDLAIPEVAQEVLLKILVGETCDFSNRQALVDYIVPAFGKNRHGTKLNAKDVMVNPNFRGKQTYEGNAYVCLTGDFGETSRQVLTYLSHMAVGRYEPIEIFPEYQCDKGVEIQYKIRFFEGGSLYGVIEEQVLTEQDLQEPVVLTTDKDSLYLSISVYLKGSGAVRIGNMHYRPSRLGAGQFIPGGQIFADAKRQEFIYHFSPGDLKPPLNVYFSGYRPAEGFEGYWMMKDFKSPFLLFGDPRLEGGAFYLGTEEYESKIKDIILETLASLEFEETDLILSGLSMGTFGALYYGAQLKPAAILIGKPLANVGDIVKNGFLVRPDEFLTAMDVLKLAQGENNEQAARQLNKRFWRMFQAREWEETLLAVAYMKQDDYDSTAYYQLLEASSLQDTRIFGRGWLGRHNDESALVISWFVRQYQRLLKDYFGKDFL